MSYAGELRPDGTPVPALHPQHLVVIDWHRLIWGRLSAYAAGYLCPGPELLAVHTKTDWHRDRLRKSITREVHPS